MNSYIEERNEKGFTLIELLVAIVVVGILTAVAIVGIAGLTDKGAKSACAATADAAKAASVVHYANTNPSVYPTTFVAMTGTTPPELDLGSKVVNTAGVLSGPGGWTLTIGGGGAAPSTFTCTP
jgi:prepilin-type N-terminal cleavage/methylation domain-containing protein